MPASSAGSRELPRVWASLPKIRFLLVVVVVVVPIVEKYYFNIGRTLCTLVSMTFA